MAHLREKHDKGAASGTAFGIVLAVIAVLTVVSIVLLAVLLLRFVRVDDREVQLRSNMEQELDLFSVTYENASGQIVVAGADGQDVVAPGTGVEYTIRLRNADKLAIDYQLIPKVEFFGGYTVPIEIRLLDQDFNYIIGDAKTWVYAEDLQDITWTASLAKNESREYYFQWRWVFDGDDEYDTFLGSYEEDIGLTVTMQLYAEANTSLESRGGLWGTGLGAIILALAACAIHLAAIVVAVVVIIRKRKEHEAPHE